MQWLFLLDSFWLSVADSIWSFLSDSIWLFQPDSNNGTEETVPCGIFTIVDPPERYLGTITLHAYDNMQKFDAAFTETTTGKPYDMLAFSCDKCGVELGHTQAEIEAMPNGTKDTWIYKDTLVETYRDLIGYIASYLGGYCVIGRDGKLYIKHYGSRPVRSITPSWRYDYRPQDYESFYTALSVVRMETNEKQIVSLDSPQEDGLIYALNEHPLLQFSIYEQRTEALTNVLNAIAEQRYTPFTANTPCDPSFEVGDIVEFSGGVAAPGNKSVLTGITVNVNGGMELECVGGNPRGANVRTKMDKALSEISSNTSETQLTSTGYVNTDEVKCGNDETVALLEIMFTTAAKAPKIDIWMEALLDTVLAASPMTATVTYKLNDDDIEYSPVETYGLDGKHILGLHYFIPSTKPNTVYFWRAYLTMHNGKAVMPPDTIHAYLSGLGLVSDEGKWDGLITVYDTLEVKDITVTGTSVYKAFTDSQIITFYDPQRNALGDTFGALSVLGASFVRQMADAVEEIEILIASATMDRDNSAFPYDRRLVTCSDDGKYSLVDKDGFDSHNIPIDRGWLEQLTIDTTPYASVTDIEVRADRNTVWEIGEIVIDSTSNIPTHSGMVECADGVYKLRHDYTQDSTTGAIDSGWLEEVTVNTAQYTAVNSITVEAVANDT